MSVYEEADTVKELITNLEDYEENGNKNILEEDVFHLPPWVHIYSTLESDIQSYENNMVTSGRNLEHFNAVNSIDLLVEKYGIYLKEMTLMSYTKILKRLLLVDDRTRCRVMMLWYFTMLLGRKNVHGHAMKKLFYDTVKALIVIDNENVKVSSCKTLLYCPI